jgi:hypothetical protein
MMVLTECLIRTVFARRGVGIGARERLAAEKIKLKIEVDGLLILLVLLVFYL